LPGGWGSPAYPPHPKPPKSMKKPGFGSGTQKKGGVSKKLFRKMWKFWVTRPITPRPTTCPLTQKSTKTPIKMNGRNPRRQWKNRPRPRDWWPYGSLNPDWRMLTINILVSETPTRFWGIFGRGKNGVLTAANSRGSGVKGTASPKRNWTHGSLINQRNKAAKKKKKKSL